MLEDRKRFLGRHWLIELFDCSPRMLNDKRYARKALRRAAREARATIVRNVVHSFNPHGVSGVAVIAESHISIHIWPEYCYIAADVFTCGTTTKPQKAANVLIEAYGAERHRIRRTRRGVFGPNGIRPKDM